MQNSSTTAASLDGRLRRDRDREVIVVLLHIAFQQAWVVWRFHQLSGAESYEMKERDFDE